MDKEVKEVKTKSFFKKFIKWPLSILILAGIVTGVTFGFISSLNSGVTQTSYFKNQYSIQAKVKENSTNQDSIEKIARDLDSRLDLFGYYSSQVNIINENNLEVLLNLDSSNDNSDPLFSYETEFDVIQEVIEVTQATMKQFYLDLKTPEGHSFFITDFQTGDIIFNKPPEEETPPTSRSYSRPPEDTLIPEDPYKLQLVSNNSARIEYVNGIPTVAFIPVSNAWNAINEANEWLLSNEGETGSYFVAWFGYETLYYIANKLDPTGVANAGGQSGLFTYCFTDSFGEQTDTIKSICEPFLIGTGESQQQLNVWNPLVSIPLSISLTQVKEAVNRLNFSTAKYSFEGEATSFSPISNSQLPLSVIMYIFIALLAIAIFTFTWYFGLLGLIGSLGAGLAGIVPLAIMVSFAIPFTPAVMFGIMVVSTLLLMALFNTLKVIHDSTKQDVSIGKMFKSYFPKIFANNSSIIGIFLVSFLALTLFGSPSFQMSVYFIVFSSLIAFLIQMIFTGFASLGFIWAFEIKNTEKWNKNWDYRIGYITRPKFGIRFERDSEKILKKSTKDSVVKKVTIFSLFFIMISWGVFGILQVTTGSGYNLKNNSNSYYRYDVSLITRYNTEDDTPSVTDPADPYNQRLMIENVEYDSSSIVSSIEQYASVDSWTISRQDYISNIILLPPNGGSSERLEYEISYGISVYSSSSLDINEFNSINTALSLVGSGYELQKTYSLTDIDLNRSEKVESYTNQTTQFNFLYSTMLAMLFAFIIYIVFYKWAFSISFIASSIIEMLLISGIISLLFIPVSPLILFSFATVFLLSLITKTSIAKKVRKELRLNGEKHPDNIKHTITSAVKKNSMQTFFLSWIFIFIGLALFISFGQAYLTFFLIAIIGSLFILLINFTIYPWLLHKNEVRVLKSKAEVLQADINKSRDMHSIEEEYIKGVNY